MNRRGELGGVLPVVELRGERYFTDPHPLYTRLRRESPVARVQADMMIRGTGYLVTSHADVTAMYRDPRLSSDAMRSIRSGPKSWLLPPIVRLLGDTMVMRDGSDHRRLRSIVGPAFGRADALARSGRIEEIADELVRSLSGRGVVDLVEDFAVQLPLRVIAELLGVGPAERARFHALVLSMHRLPSGKWGLVRRLRTMSSLVSCLRRVVDSSGGGDDLVSDVLAARDGDDRLSDREVLAMVFLLFYAGHDTTSTLVSNSVLELTRCRDQLDVLRAADDAGWDAGVTELLRFVSPVTCGSTRTALEDVTIGGVDIPAGSSVLGMLISANRDESVFDDPHTLDVTRTPGDHVAFGFGPHSCLGRHLARLETTIGLRALFEAYPNIRLADPSALPEYRPDISMRALRSLRVNVG